MEALRQEAIVEADSLVFELVHDPDTGEILKVRLSGEVVCYCGVHIRVLKWMEPRSSGKELEVQSVYYQYQAWVPRPGAVKEHSVVRYDQAHGGTPHRHEYDQNGEQVAHDMLTFDSMPRLDTMIREAVAIVASYGADSNQDTTG